MKKTLYAMALATGMMTFASCNNATEERAEDRSEQVEDAAEDAGDEIEEGAEKTGDAVEDAADDVKD
ncbi:YtxH domain-containing protein [Rufibacter immobilis]|uniref:YtxH domain-containing protein n=1 Tax=Rufibacter immobilis TaxID=1348778 RepID=A0A3M9N493_9BACT|nr:YtxH domain-containing protein [Rufibacter immobilis]RNI32592.1 YtxH domain-containing protein [Rufibacter immobilis]